MNRKSLLHLWLLVFLIFTCQNNNTGQLSKKQRLPIIDAHMHTFHWNAFGDPPPPNPITGIVPTARTDEEAIEAYLSEMIRYNIVKAVGGGPIETTIKWSSVAPNQIIPSIQFPSNRYPGIENSNINWPDINLLREKFNSGQLKAMGEITAQYAGIIPNDPILRPYFALAEELDIPIWIHLSLGPTGSPYHSNPKFRLKYGNPLLLEEVLVRHPSLRISIAHAGHPYIQEMIAMLHMYPNLYVDIAAKNWLFPKNVISYSGVLSMRG